MPIAKGTTPTSPVYNGEYKIGAIYRGLDLIYQSTKIDPNVIAFVERTVTKITPDMFDNIDIVGSFAFVSCNQLTSVEFPETVTEIGYQAFNSCNALTSVILPKSITNIGSGAFVYCANLTSMTILATTPPNLAEEGSISDATTVIYVPKDSITAYQEANIWKDLLTRTTNPVTFIGI